MSQVQTHTKRVNYDLLLAYISERRHGTWENFREAHRWLSGSDESSEMAWIAGRRLEDLGHVEFNWIGDKSWAVAPTVLTLLPRSGGRALLTGGRPRDLYDPATGEGLLDIECDELGLYPDAIGQHRGPASVFIALNTPDDAEKLAKNLQIRFTFNVAEDIAMQLPPLAAYLEQGERKELPIGFDAEFFDTDRLEFVETAETKAPGLYRSRTHGVVVHALHDVKSLHANEQWLRVPREYGCYEVLRWIPKHQIWFSYERMVMWVHQRCGLPALHARAATLCSGRLPSAIFESPPTLRYDNVPKRIAEAIAASLSQELINADEL